MSKEEIATLAAWADGGAALGDAKDAPPPIKWPSAGWLVEPELVVEMRNTRPGERHDMIPFTWVVVDADVPDREVTSPYTRGEGA